MIHPLTLLCAAPLLLASQEPQEPSKDEQPYPTTDQLLMRAFRPKHIDVHELYGVARKLIARDLLLLDEESQSTLRVSNLQLLGNSLLLYDLPGNLVRHYDLLAAMDAEAADTPVPTAERVVTQEYRPRYLSMRALSEVLSPFDSSRRDPSRRNIEYVRDRPVVVIHDTRPAVDEILAFLNRLDVPSPQVLLTCHLVVPGESSGDLPAELTEDLARLTGAGGFRRVAVGMVRTAVDSQSGVSIRLDAQQAGTYELQLELGPFDERTSTLSLVSCSLVSHDDGGTLFRTSTTLESGVYTVLGASGAEPLFVVLHGSPLAR